MPPPALSTVAAPNGKNNDHTGAASEANGEASASKKKRSRTKTGDDGGAKARKTKYLSSDSQTDGDAGRGKDLHLGGPPEGGPVFNGMDSRAIVAV